MLMLQFELLGTLGCHLCDDAEQLLIANLDMQSIAVEVVDIAESEELMGSYALRIPVLRHRESGHCLDWPFRAEEVVGWVESLR